MNKFKSLGVLILVLLMIFAYGVNVEADTEVLRAGLILPPDHAHTQAAERVAETVYEETDGGVEIQVFPANQLGTAPDLVEGLRAGTVDMFIGATTWMNFLDIDWAVLGTFYLFDNQEMCRNNHLENPYFLEMKERLEEDFGIITLTQDWDRRGRHFVTTEETGPIETPEDLEGLEVRSSEQDVWLETFRMAGAEPTPIAFEELFMGLQQGIIDGMEGALEWIRDNRYYEVAPHISLTGHNFEQGGVYISESSYNDLDEDEREIVMESFRDISDWHNELAAEREEEAIEEMEEAGAEIHEVDRDLWQSHFRDILWPDLQEEIGFSQELLESIMDDWE